MNNDTNEFETVNLTDPEQEALDRDRMEEELEWIDDDPPDIPDRPL